ncbi:hypothetical protein BDK51DRAFT_46031 [Blyttiomyces helicus]|uniref:F-box domain-containing protein n=1 Tax=Blyttiomyces helicus TaxID=388810 RepID=A0A4P9WKD3_9FUNG|nr:hypothetical protein BDK51DRAFT_46031 [Blyttiomyces helicus]|eukprot:RKO93431.1 hypothetical protein BDK51DRAFT_46031 [Blyttiomyces helicus]
MFPAPLGSRRTDPGDELVRINVGYCSEAAMESGADVGTQLRAVRTLPAELVAEVLRWTRTERQGNWTRRRILLACCSVSKAWYHPARAALLADLDVDTPCRLPLLALSCLASDALQRGPDGRLPPLRRLSIEPVAMPSMRVLNFALPMFANLRVLIIDRATATVSLRSDSLSWRGIATILEASKRLVVFTWREPTQPADKPELPLDDQEWAIIEKRVRTLVSFEFAPRRKSTPDEKPSVMRIIEAVGPGIRQWAVTGHEDISSLVPGACQNLELLRVSATLGPLRPGFFTSLAARAPSLRKVIFRENTTAANRDVADLLNSFPGIEELDLGGQYLLSDAALYLLLNHRPLKVLDIKGTNFTAPAVISLLAARGSLLESLSIEETRWPTLRALQSIGTHTPKLSVLLLKGCHKLRSTHAKIAKCFPSLRFISRYRWDDALPDGVQMFRSEYDDFSGYSMINSSIR